MNLHLEAKGIRIATGTIVDATLTPHPLQPRTRKRNAIRDAPDEEGQPLAFRSEDAYRRGSKQGTGHSMATSADNVSSVHLLPVLLRGEQRKAWGSSGYQS